MIGTATTLCCHRQRSVLGIFTVCWAGQHSDFVIPTRESLPSNSRTSPMTTLSPRDGRRRLYNRYPQQMVRVCCRSLPIGVHWLPIMHHGPISHDNGTIYPPTDTLVRCTAAMIMISSTPVCGTAAVPQYGVWRSSAVVTLIAAESRS